MPTLAVIAWSIAGVGCGDETAMSVDGDGSTSGGTSPTSSIGDTLDATTATTLDSTGTSTTTGSTSSDTSDTSGTSQTTTGMTTTGADSTGTDTDSCSREVCDGIDNDCDDEIDEGCECVPDDTQPCYEGPAATEGVGACVGGTQTCGDDGLWGACEGQVVPEAEACDGIDNDCDGELDEGFGPETCGLGTCEVTVQTCEEGVPQTCEPLMPAPTEACDGLDDDCDGEVDEGCSCVDGENQSCYGGPQGTEGVGQCQAGLQTCAGGQFGDCEGDVAPATESCNGLDDDCDSVVDQGNPEGGTACVTGLVGVCAQGETACVAGALECEPLSDPSPEVCDGLDNDCDTGVDEGNPGGGVPCSTGEPGVCDAGVTACQFGALDCVQSAQPSAELCDGLDNDCDGTTDEGCNCIDGQMQTCYTGPGGTEGVGVCTAGTQTCQNGQFGACTGEVTPQAETCDGVDNDCDGVIDDGNPDGGGSCQTGQAGVCDAGTEVCQGGALQCEQSVMPSAEICDGLDNDCDTATDEGDPGGGAACSTGLPGVCASGTTACQNGAIECVQDEPSAAEVCDGADNDCDGQLDEGCNCIDGNTQPCYSGPIGTEGVGQCVAGTQTCINGAWGACVGETTPAAEACDGIDNDCDGTADDGDPGAGAPCQTGLSGVCAQGQTACQGGGIVCEQTVFPSSELCDGLDNDCDTGVDEGNPESGAACSTGAQGVCDAGTTACQSGVLECVQDQQPSPEVCDGDDNDCDGVVDDGDPGAGQACGTGLQGACAAGTTSCTGGQIDCVQDQFPVPEVCDGIDNDCNGMVDDAPGDVGQACQTGQSGVCDPGTTVCQAGVLTCEQDQQPSSEVCDGLDNDCDGTADDGDPGGGQACVTGQPGACSAGTTTCSGGGIVCAQDQFPVPETCNGTDDDCNGAVDDAPADVGQVCSTGEPGVCDAGTTVCNGGALDCSQDVMSSPETCDGLDNDCDGTVDDGDPGGGVACDTTLEGVCADGTTACAGGAVTCEQTIFPTAELCDGLDNDCDGVVDQGNPEGGAACSTSQPGICADGTVTCMSAELVCVADQQPQTEVCFDLLDNDCDGSIDDGCSCDHDKCVTGGPLTYSCTDACVGQICDAMPSCCTDGWTSACVDAVVDVCAELTCGVHVGSCDHPQCDTGFPLQEGCDAPVPDCVDQICQQDPSCCSIFGFWDQQCVENVNFICGLTCP